MPRFPNKESEIVALADSIKDGLRNNLATFPAPPVNWSVLWGRRYEFTIARESAMSASAIAESATEDKDDALETLIDAMRTDLRYAENTTNFDDAKLKLIGWGGKKARTPLAIPGQCRLLEAPKQGESGGGWVFLDWKSPADGGKPAAYKVQRRERAGGPEGAWETIATAILTEATLVDQPEKIELEYRVIAINKAGESIESNSVLVVL